MLAAVGGSKGIVQALLDAGANKDCQDNVSDKLMLRCVVVAAGTLWRSGNY
jgi:hypothetical protein